MNSHDITAAIRSLPKVELHVHLEGATDAETIWTLSQRNGISLPATTLDEWKQHYAFQNFQHFIEVYDLCAATMTTPEDWSLMVQRFIAGQASQNIIYTEAFLSTSLAMSRLPLDEWIDAVVEGARTGERQHGCRIRFIPDISRHMPSTQHDVLDCVIAAQSTGYVIGLGLGGIEEGYPASLFTETFAAARNAGLHVVAHAGETTGADLIRESIDLLQVERIGHGIGVLEDSALTGDLAKRKIPFEVCPTSNYCLGVVRAGEPHPIRKMVDAGLQCTVNSDDPPMFGTSLVDEYLLLYEQGFTLEELQRLNQNALKASFLTEIEKRALQ